MDKYRELSERLKGLMPHRTLLYQGQVKSIEGKTCTVTIEGLDFPDVRLRASTTEEEEEILLTPALGSSVIVGSLTGDLDQLIVLSIDKVETIVLHGGKQGGLVLVEALTKKLQRLETELNDLKQAFSSWTPTPNDGGASLKAGMSAWAGERLQTTQISELENRKIKQ